MGGGGGGGGGLPEFQFAFITPREEWAVPGGTAIPGQPMAEEAPDNMPKVKYQFRIYGLQWRTYKILI